MDDEFPETVETGEYTLQGMFWECAAPEPSAAVQTLNVKKHLMPPLRITLDKQTPFSEFAGNSVAKTTAQLPTFLRAQGLHRFFPMKNASVEYDRQTRTISICLYQNADMHKRVYCMIDQGFVCEPNQVIMARLEPLYQGHGLHYYDDEVYAAEN